MPSPHPEVMAYAIDSENMTVDDQWQLIQSAINNFDFEFRSNPVLFRDEPLLAYRRLSDRPKGRALLDFLASGKHLFVTHFDHLGCDDLDSFGTMESLVNRGVNLHVLDFGGLRIDVTTDEGRLCLKAMARLLKRPREMIAKRTKAALAALRASRGYIKLRPGLGHRIEENGGDRRIVPWPYEQRWANQVWHWRYNKAWTWREIRDELNRLGIKRAKGGKWNTDHISLVLNCEAMPFPNEPLALEAECRQFNVRTADRTANSV